MQKFLDSKIFIVCAVVWCFLGGCLAIFPGKQNIANYAFMWPSLVWAILAVAQAIREQVTVQETISVDVPKLGDPEEN